MAGELDVAVGDEGFNLGSGEETVLFIRAPRAGQGNRVFWQNVYKRRCRGNIRRGGTMQKRCRAKRRGDSETMQSKEKR